MHEIRISFYLTKFASHFFIVLIGILYLDSISAMDNQLKMRINQIVDNKLNLARAPVISTQLSGRGGSYANRSDNSRGEMYSDNYDSEDDRYSKDRYSQDRYSQDRDSDDYEDRRSNRGLKRSRQNREEDDYSDDRNSDSLLQYDESGNLIESSSKNQKSNTDFRRSNSSNRNYSDRSYSDRNYRNSSDHYNRGNRGGENWGNQQKNTRRKSNKSHKKKNSTARKGMIKLFTVKKSTPKWKLFRSARSNALTYRASTYGSSFSDSLDGYKIKSYAGMSSENTSISSNELNSVNIQDTLNMLKQNQADPLETIEYKEVNSQKKCGSDPNARYLTKSGKYTTKNKYFAHRSCS